MLAPFDPWALGEPHSLAISPMRSKDPLGTNKDEIDEDAKVIAIPVARITWYRHCVRVRILVLLEIGPIGNHVMMIISLCIIITDMYK